MQGILIDVESLIALVQLILVVLLSAAPFVILIALVFRLRGRRADRTANVFSRAAAAGVFPHSLRPPMDVEIAHERTPVSNEMSPEALRQLRDTGSIELPD
jgi:hypothetical protein